MLLNSEISTYPTLVAYLGFMAITGALSIWEHPPKKRVSSGMTQSVPINKLTELDTLSLTRESLDVSEFEVFRMAYTAWYGEQPAMQRIEHHFDDYLVDGVLPFYVRHYCRQYIDNRPESLDAVQKRERRSRFAERLTMGLLILFVAAALILG